LIRYTYYALVGPRPYERGDSKKAQHDTPGPMLQTQYSLHLTLTEEDEELCELHLQLRIRSLLLGELDICVRAS